MEKGLEGAVTFAQSQGRTPIEGARFARALATTLEAAGTAVAVTGARKLVTSKPKTGAKVQSAARTSSVQKTLATAEQKIATHEARMALQVEREMAAAGSSASRIPHHAYSTPEAAFSLRIDPITGKGPMHVDARLFTWAESYTKEGSMRNRIQFWKFWAEKYPGTLSETNFKLIHNSGKPLAPEVDTQWLKHFPEHQRYLGDKLVHHHIDHRDLVTALPKKLHESQPGRSMFHQHLGGTKK